MAEITAQLVKQLRERTGAGMMECKSALTEANGDLPAAEVVLRKKGITSASKKASRTTKQGLIGTYIHHGGQLGVLVEVNCESDFVARTDDFQELVHDIAMHVAAADPQFIRKEDVTAAALEKEKDIQRAESYSLPIALVVLLFVFGSLVAASMPLALALVAVPVALAIIHGIALRYDTTTFVENVATVVGLGISIDYSLFMRFVRFKVGDAPATGSGEAAVPESVQA